MNNFLATPGSVIAPLCATFPTDNRLYLTIRVFNFPMVCLLDTGASNSVVGAAGLEFLASKGVSISIKPVNLKVQTADGVSQECEGRVSLPMGLNGVTRCLDCLVVPAVTQPLILGMDFGAVFDIRVDLRNKWFRSGGSSEVLTNKQSKVTGQRMSSLEAVRDRMSLSIEQEDRLGKVIDKFNELVSDKLGRSTVFEHKIDTGDAEPFKQRQYMLSPAMQAHLHKEIEDMLRLGVIRESHSAWSSPIILVKKKMANFGLATMLDD